MSDELRTVETRFGGLSRGRSWGKWYAGKTQPTGNWVWVDKQGSTLYIPDGPGYLVYGSSDGFRRKEKHGVVFEDNTVVQVSDA